MTTRKEVMKMARRNFYVFPEDMELTKEMIVEHGLEVEYKYMYEGKEYTEYGYPRDLGWFDRGKEAGCYDFTASRMLEGKVSTIKKLMKMFGGHGFTEHYERDGGLFETTPILLKGNNTKIKYNRHL